MRNPLLPTYAQTLECFPVFQQLTRLYLPIYLVRLDERTDNIVIIAGEEVVMQINRDGDSKIL